MKQLGEINFSEPEEYKRCRKLGHTPKERKLSNCYYEYTCEKCGISWRVDSGD